MDQKEIIEEDGLSEKVDTPSGRSCPNVSDTFQDRMVREQPTWNLRFEDIPHLDEVERGRLRPPTPHPICIPVEDSVSSSSSPNDQESPSTSSQGSFPIFDMESMPFEPKPLRRSAPPIFRNSAGGRMRLWSPTFRHDNICISPTYGDTSPLSQRQDDFERHPTSSNSLRGLQAGSRAMIRLLAGMPKIKLTDSSQEMKTENADEEGTDGESLVCRETLESDDEKPKCADGEGDENENDFQMNLDGVGVDFTLKHSRDEDENEEEFKKNSLGSPQKRLKRE